MERHWDRTLSETGRQLAGKGWGVGGLEKFVSVMFEGKDRKRQQTNKFTAHKKKTKQKRNQMRQTFAI